MPVMTSSLVVDRGALAGRRPRRSDPPPAASARAASPPVGACGGPRAMCQSTVFSDTQLVGNRAAAPALGNEQHDLCSTADSSGTAMGADPLPLTPPGCDSPLTRATRLTLVIAVRCDNSRRGGVRGPRAVWRSRGGRDAAPGGGSSGVMSAAAAPGRRDGRGGRSRRRALGRAAAADRPQCRVYVTLRKLLGRDRIDTQGPATRSGRARRARPRSLRAARCPVSAADPRGSRQSCWPRRCGSSAVPRSRTFATTTSPRAEAARIEELRLRRPRGAGSRRNWRSARHETRCPARALIAEAPLRERLRGAAHAGALPRGPAGRGARGIPARAARPWSTKLGIEPGPELQRARVADPRPGSRVATPTRHGRRRSPAAPPTPLIGRERELAEIAAPAPTRRRPPADAHGAAAATGKTRLGLRSRARGGALADGSSSSARSLARPGARRAGAGRRARVGETRACRWSSHRGSDRRPADARALVDNVEHVVAAAPGIGRALGRGRPEAAAPLVRATLHLAGEHATWCRPSRTRLLRALFCDARGGRRRDRRPGWSRPRRGRRDLPRGSTACRSRSSSPPRAQRPPLEALLARLGGRLELPDEGAGRPAAAPPDAPAYARRERRAPDAGEA